MCASMIDMKKVMTRNMELEEELKTTHDGYEEEIAVLLEKNEDLKKKLGIFLGDPALGRTTTQKTTSSSMTPTPTLIVMMIMKTKLEWISWNLPPIKISRRPPYYH